MNGKFLKFKRKIRAVGVLKSVLAALAVFACTVGCFTILAKLEIYVLPESLRIPICAGAAAFTFLVAFFLLRISNKKLARELDRKFSLDEKVSTMVAFYGDEGEMAALQRSDTESTLAAIPRRKFHAKRLWAYFLAVAIGAGTVVGGIMIPEKEPYVEPEVVIPFEISEMQLAGIAELIKYVTESEMQSPYKENVIDSLNLLLEELKAATTEPEMQASMAKAMTTIAEETYNSSSMTEILNAMWATEDEYVRELVKALNTSNWKDSGWGDFAEKYDKARKLIASIGLESGAEEQRSGEAEGGEVENGQERLTSITWAMEKIIRNSENGLANSKIADNDPLYAVIYKLIRGEDGESGLYPYSVSGIDKSAEELLGEIDGVFEAMTDELYEVSLTMKKNTNVGEYVLKRLEMLFGIPAPAFERPGFNENSSDGGSQEQDKDDEEGPSSGGVGEGVVFGSDDLVLDPLTGEYVEYGTLLAKYNTLMIEKLGDDKYGYTEEQKKAIEKYFALLYGGFKDEGDN